MAARNTVIQTVKTQLYRNKEHTYVSELLQLIFQILNTSRFWTPLGDLRTTYNIHLGLIGKHVVDFLLVLIELFRYLLRLRRYNRKDIENRRFRSNAVSLTQNFIT